MRRGARKRPHRLDQAQYAEIGDANLRKLCGEYGDLHLSAPTCLCTQLVRGHSTFAAIAAPSARRGLADWQVRKVTGYMRAHLDEAVGPDVLAGLVGLSRFHFCTAFRQATGRTPHEWLVALRIEQARRLLAHPELAVTEVALAVGYETPSSFAAAFRKVTGTTPSAFRRAL